MSSCGNPFVEKCATLLTTIARLSRCEGPLPALRNGEAAYRCSAFAHAVGGLGGGAGANLLLDPAAHIGIDILPIRSEEHTSELQSLMRISYAVFCLNKKTNKNTKNNINIQHNRQH